MQEQSFQVIESVAQGNLVTPRVLIGEALLWTVALANVQLYCTFNIATWTVLSIGKVHKSSLTQHGEV